MRRAHPRAGGENSPARSCPTAIAGSSPRGRGNPPQRRHARLDAWLIPARAGKTGGATRAKVPSRAHPRAGGENSPACGRRFRASGSSPRGRGKRDMTRPLIEERGLIPARAGKTSDGGRQTTTLSAHPRAGGENFCDDDARRGEAGSSPRRRGKQRMRGTRAAQWGLIPARAGKTSWSRPPTLTARTHPRAGGENECRHCGHLPAPGSSPRGRGKPTANPSELSSTRLIPARAGKTRGELRLLRGPAAHPRAGGENRLTWTGRTLAPGSSPRGRGKLIMTKIKRFACRLIPARAGKTSSSRSGRTYRRAHPRAGGENTFFSNVVISPCGSSPRGRGKQHS